MIKNICIKLSNEEFYDDAQLLVRSFFSDAKKVCHGDVSADTDDSSYNLETFEYVNGPDEELTIYADRFLPEGEELKRSRGEVHDIFKRRLYEALAEYTGHTLPWGFLTGVRPAKRAMEMIKSISGCQDDICDEDIISGFSRKYMTSEKKAALALRVAKNELRILKEHGISDVPSKNTYQGFSLYVGIPFCPTTCLYCSFPSIPIGKCDDEFTEAYIDALCREIELSSHIYTDSLKKKELYKGYLKPSSVYIGGGTPTSLDEYRLGRIIDQLKQFFVIGSDMEFCVEAGRPDSITLEKLEALLNMGVNRISVNPQTVNQKTLDLIGRSHTVDDFYNGFKLARKAGFTNINTDIIIGLPGEAKEELQNTLNAIRELSPESLTVHSLAVKRASRLNIEADSYEGHTRYNSQELMDMTAELAERMGMSPYYMYRQQNMAGNFENTGYACTGKESLYNIAIMEEIQDILALGAGASSKFMMGEDRFERAVNVKDVGNYILRVDEMCERKRRVLQDSAKT